MSEPTETRSPCAETAPPFHWRDCGQVGGGWPHPASAHARGCQRFRGYSENLVVTCRPGSLCDECKAAVAQYDGYPATG